MLIQMTRPTNQLHDQAFCEKVFVANDKNVLLTNFRGIFGKLKENFWQETVGYSHSPMHYVLIITGHSK